MSKTAELIRLAQAGDQSAKEQLVCENSRLIWSVARRFQGRGTDLEDLYQLGCLGFLKALEGFDTEYGTQFSTYAVPKISGEIRRFLRDDGAVKVSRTLKERALTIKIASNRLLAKLGREPNVSEIACETGFTLEEIAAAETATAAVESMQKENGEDGFVLENVLSTTESEDSVIEKLSLKQGIEQLPERESTVIRLRYYHGMTQSHVSRILQVSQVQISRIEKKAIAMLKELML